VAPEHEGSSPHSQQPATGTYSEPIDIHTKFCLNWSLVAKIKREFTAYGHRIRLLN